MAPRQATPEPGRPNAPTGDVTPTLLTAEEAADLGPLLRALTAALREVLGCCKTYVALFAEAEGFAHVHFHVMPRQPDP